MTAPGVRPAIARSSEATTRPLAALGALMIAQMRASLARSRARRDLYRLLQSDRRMLDDIGVTRDAVFRELDGL